MVKWLGDFLEFDSVVAGVGFEELPPHELGNLELADLLGGFAHAEGESFLNKSVDTGLVIA